MIVLFFGQPSSGKTTLAHEVVKQLKSRHTLHIDGDRWREVTQNKDYSKEGRLRNLYGAFDMALYLENEGYIPVLSFVCPYESSRQYLNRNTSLIQIYLESAEDRGRKSYYATGFEEPKGQFLKLDTSVLGIEDCMREVMEYINK